ncbi:hypothetical protein PHMEG_00022479 [Phytophthora megakarya]|uniref:Uncharacterized protein n=1 Tax=Phytophthora megakarya TaxID=4795 RepID=A0A225VJB5_9STRA|nr:hypothetical protein PHMEG_00022479 [Phytophthora megakarya]
MIIIFEIAGYDRTTFRAVWRVLCEKRWMPKKDYEQAGSVY